MKIFRKFIAAVAIFSLFGSLMPLPATASTTDGTIDPANKYAWCENIGWINFGTTAGNVHVTDSELTGYAWSDNIGWINLAPTNGGVTNDGNGNLGGYAWGENIGWINFNPGGTNRATINTSGEFAGFAWGENIGWCTFTTADFKVKTDWRPVSARSYSSSGKSTREEQPEEQTGNNEPVIVTKDGFGFAINNGAAYANSPNVTLKFVVSAPENVEKILLSQSPTFTQPIEIIFSELKNFELSGGEGEKLIYAKFILKDGKTTEILNDSILVDMTPPAKPTIKPFVAETLAKGTPLFSGTGENETTIFLEIDNLLLYQSLVANDETWSYQTETPFSIGTHKVKISARDAAENTSEILETSFVIPEKKPIVQLPVEKKEKEREKEREKSSEEDKTKKEEREKEKLEDLEKKITIERPDEKKCAIDVWLCEEWSLCEKKRQTRKCSLTFNCPLVSNLPPFEEQTCEQTEEITDEGKKFNQENIEEQLDKWRNLLQNDYDDVVKRKLLEKIDTDGDGLTNEEEARLGTDPFLYDTDGDGMNDTQDPFPLDPKKKADDANGNNIPDEREKKLETDGIFIKRGRGDTDSDQDGLSDTIEAYIGTDPTAGDTDGDDIPDSDEYLIHHSSPRDSDSTIPDEILITQPNDGDVVPPNQLQITGTLPENFDADEDLGVWLIDEDRRAIYVGRASSFENHRFAFVTTGKLKKGHYLMFVKSLDGKNQSQTLVLQVEGSSPLRSPQPQRLANQILTQQVIAEGGTIEIPGTEDIVLSGVTELGTRVIANWESALFSAAIIADVSGGGFSIRPPQAPKAGAHRVAIYAKDIEGGRVSPAVTVRFTVTEEGAIQNVQIGDEDAETAEAEGAKPGIFIRAQEAVVKFFKTIGNGIGKIWKGLTSIFRREKTAPAPEVSLFHIPTVRPSVTLFDEQSAIMTREGEKLLQGPNDETVEFPATILAKGFVQPKGGDTKVKRIFTKVFFVSTLSENNEPHGYASILSTPSFPIKEAAFSQGLVVGHYVYTDPNRDGIFETDFRVPPMPGRYRTQTTFEYEDGIKKTVTSAFSSRL